MTEVCGICLETLKTPIGIMKECQQHQFCYACLQKWLSKTPSCPMCRVRITKIARLPRSQNQTICWQRAESVLAGTQRYSHVSVARNLLEIFNIIAEEAVIRQHQNNYVLQTYLFPEFMVFRRLHNN